MREPSTPADAPEQHRAAIRRYIQYMVRDAAEAEDLTQEALLRAHQQLSTLKDAGALESWLYQIATHVTVDRIRQRSRTRQRLADEPAEECAVVDQKPSPFAVVGQHEMSTCVQLHVAGLSDAYKAVLLLHDTDGLTAQGIAAVLGLPLTTVKMRLHRARRQLQATLHNACSFTRDERGVFVCEPKPKGR